MRLIDLYPAEYLDTLTDEQLEDLIGTQLWGTACQEDDCQVRYIICCNNVYDGEVTVAYADDMDQQARLVPLPVTHVNFPDLQPTGRAA